MIRGSFFPFLRRKRIPSEGKEKMKMTLGWVWVDHTPESRILIPTGRAIFH